MANYIHLFRCIRCSGFVEYKNKSDDCNDAPSVHHDELAEFVNKKKTVVNCTGRLLYYSTRLVEIPVYIAAPVDEEWKMFENTVSASWRIYVN
ncbi:MAG: hypothetical protein Q7U23_00005, partial [Methylococcales bacterium]|nr:hypothetical protein [Methylococcales bacterium]